MTTVYILLFKTEYALRSLVWELQVDKKYSHTGGFPFGHTSGAVRRQLCASTIISDAWTAPAFLNGHRTVPRCSNLS
jgi:hypothetical protein